LYATPTVPLKSGDIVVMVREGALIVRAKFAEAVLAAESVTLTWKE
jgi:hypothetical protein